MHRRSSPRTDHLDDRLLLHQLRGDFPPHLLEKPTERLSLLRFSRCPSTGKLFWVLPLKTLLQHPTDDGRQKRQDHHNETDQLKDRHFFGPCSSLPIESRIWVSAFTLFIL